MNKSLKALCKDMLQSLYLKSAGAVQLCYTPVQRWLCSQLVGLVRSTAFTDRTVFDTWIKSLQETLTTYQRYLHDEQAAVLQANVTAVVPEVQEEGVQGVAVSNGGPQAMQEDTQPQDSALLTRELTTQDLEAIPMMENSDLVRTWVPESQA
eukprot:TRINITY_DN66543_c0_g1_i1.p1 TRINITY_DN66543_c0_g1~~TRINITY_DN66543_c0_g1_i1.p1  ORF type:complete len:152 (-),score=9.55 TRINITY_DN66543_c0_g1_i1:124-579(-)